MIVMLVDPCPSGLGPMGSHETYISLSPTPRDSALLREVSLFPHCEKNRGIGGKRMGMAGVFSLLFPAMHRDGK